ncbi:MAG: DNA repair protein RecN, partial [Pseudomonadales bacterium]|nr:DNA repair protein RecN [Pseudomonadales bacterium]
SEVSALDAELLQLANADENLSFAQQAQRLISEDDTGGGLAALQSARLALGKVKDPNLGAARDQLDQSLLQIDELNRDLLRYLDVSQADPQRLHWVEQRMQQIHDISRKHRCPPEQLITLHATLSDELAQLSDSDAAVETLNDDIQTAKSNWEAASARLSKKRNTGKKKIETAVKNLLTQMGMSNARLEVSLAPYTQPSRFGQEETTFLIATNPGQTPQPLNKIASGGELSRISLAIQVATLGTNAIGTIIFDEVDVGIGGGVAQTVGALLRTLSAQAQILCVTHLGQVAAQGHNHFKVSKDTSATAIELLSDSGRVEEIARMLSGIEITKKSLAHAREMMMTAHSV